MVGTQKVSQAVAQTDAAPQANIESILGAAANSATLTDDTTPDNTPIFHNLRELYQVTKLCFSFLLFCMRQL